MGYLTTITIHNDMLHEFEKNPELFAKTIFDGINQANRNCEEASMPFLNSSGYLNVQPSRHADDDTLYLHYGNCVTGIGEFNRDFEKLAQRNINCAEKFAEKAWRIALGAKKMIEKLKKVDKVDKVDKVKS